jgi:hypothetical protein
MYFSNMTNMRRKKEQPRLFPADPVDNGDGTSDIRLSYNAAFEREFKKLTKQAATPLNIGTWFKEQIHIDPWSLRKYLLIPEGEDE